MKKYNVTALLYPRYADSSSSGGGTYPPFKVCFVIKFTRGSGPSWQTVFKDTIYDLCFDMGFSTSGIGYPHIYHYELKKVEVL